MFAIYQLMADLSPDTQANISANKLAQELQPRLSII